METADSPLSGHKRCLSPDTTGDSAKRSLVVENDTKDKESETLNNFSPEEDLFPVECLAIRSNENTEIAAEETINPAVNIRTNESLPSTSNAQSSITDDEITELIEGLGDDIDALLDEKAEKNKLTIKNVKSILKHVISNKYVLAMVRNTMRAESVGECELEEAEFEPKLTRSKAKELREKQAPLPWPVSAPPDPRKEPISKKLLTEKYSDDEGSSDEEYRPNSEELHDSEDVPVKMIEPIGDPDDNQLIIVEPGISQDEADRIALRTRSKLPLVDTPLEQIEASFVAPDFSFDMYDTLIDDENWQNFLKDFSKPHMDEKGSNDQPDDENDDPEYNIMDDHEEEEEDEEEVENEGEPTQSYSEVSKEEMNALMSEMLVELIQIDPNFLEDQPLVTHQEMSQEQVDSNYQVAEIQELQQNLVPESQQEFPQELQPELQSEKPVELVSETNEWMNASERRQLDEQMRMHVQLLSQSFLLSHGIAELSSVNDDTEVYLRHLKEMSTLQEQAGNQSAFQAYNLNEALTIVDNFKMMHVSPSVSPSGTKRTIPQKVKSLISRSKVFLYPDLLPTTSFQVSSLSNSKTVFTPAEDNLIVLGLDQFSWSKSAVQLIQEYLIPVKTVQQIKVRIKNRKSSDGNPIKCYFKDKQLPFISQETRPFDPLNVLPPCKMNRYALPLWMEPYLSKKARTVIPVPPKPVYQPKLTAKPVKRITRRNYSPILPRGYVSPLKKITPILKKYGHHRRIVQMNSYSTLLPAKPTIPTKDKLKPLRPKNVVPEEHSMNLRTKSSAVIRPLAPRKVNALDESQKQRSASESAVEVIKSHKDTSNSKSNDENSGEKEVVSMDVDASDDVEEDAVDDEQDLAALMAASSTICRKNSMIKKKNKQQRDLESTLALLSPNLMESDPKKEDREKHFAQSYLCRVLDALKEKPDQIERFLLLLCSYENSSKSAMQLFSEVNEILRDFPALIEDFVGFLLPEDAKVCGKYAEYVTLCKIREFFRKLEVHFVHQPQHIQRILRTFSQLQQQPDLTSTHVIAALQPLLRNQSHLLEELTQLLPDSAPPDCLMTDFEEIQIPNSDCEISDDSVEEIVIPETKDPYGGKDCPCECHASTSDLRMQNRSRHCVQCGTKFFDGRIYIQTGKVLKPAQVIYTSPKGKSWKNNNGPQTSENKVEFSLSSPSPSLASHNTNLKSTVGKSFSFEGIECEKKTENSSVQKSNVAQASTKKSLHTDGKTLSNSKSRNVNHDNFVSSLPCDVNEDAILFADSSGTSSCVPSDFSCLSKVISPHPVGLGHVKDINIEVSCPKPATETHFDDENKKSSEQLWTRNHDRIIFETCQKNGINDETFVLIAKAIPTKTPQQLRNRFNDLMSIVQKHLNANR